MTATTTVRPDPVVSPNDVRTGRERPAWVLVHHLIAHITPALIRHGDAEDVGDLLAALRREGTGAARQRAVHRQTGSAQAVLDRLIAETAGEYRLMR